MRNLLFIVFCVASGVSASAQKPYFIYLQTENNIPFYVKMSDKIYSSATSGYLILSNLVDSSYTFSVGFPSSSSESKFLLRLGGKDRGFLIKNFESGLGLFDLQNLSVIRAQKDESAKNISYQRRNDAFSSLLSRAANDTSLLYSVVRIKEDVALQKEPAKVEEDHQKTQEVSATMDSTSVKPLQTDIARQGGKPDTAAIIGLPPESGKNEDVAANSSGKEVKKDTVVLVEPNEQGKQTETAVTRKPDPARSEKKVDTASVLANTVAEGAVFKRSTVKKHAESSTTEGFGLVFYDIYEGGGDTIRLLIPNPPIIFKQSTEGDSSLDQKDFIQVDELKKDTVRQAPVVVSIKSNVPQKPRCKSIASGKDFFRLRKNMAARTSDEAMVAEAKKIFRNKCFTTEQIKNLSSLFLTSAGKFLFFDAAYLHVSDREKFPSLESELKDDYYLKRFKALIGE